MNNIDLTLAVNYIPACSCTMRLLFFLLWLSVLSAYENTQYFVILGIVLYLDRILHRQCNIFDSNAVIATVFFTCVYQHMRKSSSELNFTVLIVYFFWALVALVFQWDKGFVLKWVHMIPFSQHLVEVHLTAAILFYLLYHKMQTEPYGCVVGKSIVFNIIVIAWIYIVGLKASHVQINNLWMVRYLPILILPLWMSAMFAAVSVGILVWNFRQMFVPPTILVEKVVPTIVEETKQDLDDLEAMFRLAQQQAGR